MGNNDRHHQAVNELAAGLPCGRLTLKLATTPEELESVYKLRFRVFNEELQEGIPENAKLGLDIDAFDRHCDHLMVIDHGLVIGTYRLLYGPKRPPEGFYSETEFNLEKLHIDAEHSVELGRGCIDPQHRKKTTLMALFWGLHRYMMARKARFLLGCGSLPPMNEDDAEATFQALKSSGRVEDIEGVAPRPSNAFQGEAHKGRANVPPLVSLYLEFGAKIIGRPAFDPVFRCYDLFLVFDMEHLSDWGNELLLRFDRRLLSAGGEASEAS